MTTADSSDPSPRPVAPAAEAPPSQPALTEAAAPQPAAPEGDKSPRVKIGSQRDDYRPGPGARSAPAPQSVGTSGGPRPGGGGGNRGPGGPNRGPGGGGRGPGGPGGKPRRGRPGEGGGDGEGSASETSEFAQTGFMKISKVQLPSLREKLPAEVEADLDAAFGGKSMDDLLAPDLGVTRQERFERETKLQGKIARIHRDTVFVDLPSRQQGALSRRSFPEDKTPEIGATLDVIVARWSEEDAIYQLNLPGEAIDAADWSQLSNGSIVEARVEAVNKGGLECLVGKIRAFLPAGQVSLHRIEDFSPLIGEKFNCLVTKCEPERRNLILSRKAILEREKEAAEERIRGELAEGQVREGTVRAIKDFGAFVDLGGLDGLIHIGQLSWAHVKHPNELLQIGQKVQVKVLKIDSAGGRISLSLRDLQNDPWKSAASNYPVGELVQGKVTRTTDFGAFVELEAGVEGLIHISELDHARVFRVTDILKPGDPVEAKVVSFDPEKRRLGLSRKAAIQKVGAAPKVEPEEEVVEDTPPPRRYKGPLKGGTSSAGGSEGGLGLTL